tara:strand:+ start:249 stop:521 length:273 start_codon:yes stop_codon:yes gene_type:complete
MAKKSKNKDGIAIMIGIGKIKKNKKTDMMYGGMASGKKHNYSGGGNVTDNLKPIPTGNKGKGLSKLPTEVRNNMGFMQKGGMVKNNKKEK